MARIAVLLFILFVLHGHTFVHTELTTKTSPQPMWNFTYTDKLRKDLLLNYDKFARPSQHYNVTKVAFGLEIHHVEFDEFKSTLTVHCWLRLVWNDEKLKWNESNYGGLGVLRLADHEIWQPDIFLYNSATTLSITHYSNVYCLVYPKGEVIWIPMAQLNVLCDLNLKYWPFDTQKCVMKFASWTFSGDEIDLSLYNDQTEAELDLLVNNTEWSIVKTSVKKTDTHYPCCPEAYPDVTVLLILRRLSTSYKTLIITPAFVVIILILLSFWLPPQAGEKIVLNGCTAIIICLFMLYFTQKIPTMGTHTPMIVLFYSSCLYVVAFSMISSVIVICLCKTKHNTPLPWIIKQPLSGKFGILLGLNTYIQQVSLTSRSITVEEMHDHQVIDFEEQSNEDEYQKISNKIPIQQEWVLLAVAVDRLAFCFFCFLFLILTITYSV